MSSILLGLAVKLREFPTVILRRYGLLINVALILSILNLLPSKHWLQEVNANIGGYYLFFHAIILLLCLLSLAALNVQRRLMALHFLMLLFYFSQVAPFYYLFGTEGTQTAEASPGKKEASLSIFYANVHGPNERYAETKEQIVKSAAGIVGLVEVTPGWVRALELERDYPYQVVVPREDNYGLALYSRYPLEGVLTSVGDSLPPVIYSRLTLPERPPLIVSLLHAKPPVSTEDFADDRILLRRVSTLLRHSVEDVLVMGDFNATPFSDVYRRFMNGSRVKNAMEGFGLFRSWSSISAIHRFTFDHILYRGKLNVASFQTLPAGGSDHFPYLVTLTY